MEDTILRRTWAEIDLDALEHNYNVARQKIGPGVKYLGVVKADAYGHGAVQVARKLEQLGADYLAVSSLDEGRELRHGGITMPILILGHTPPEMVSQLIEYNITQAVSAKAKAEAYSAEAVKCGGTLRVHIKVDTGMSRLGFLVRGEHFETGVEAIAESCALPGLDPEGIFTHFAVSDMDGADYEAYTREQFGVFTHVLDALGQTLSENEDLQIYTSGATNILKYPELSDSESAAGLLSTFEEKDELVNLVTESLSEGERKGNEIQVYIGNEAPVQTMKDCSVVTATYDLGEGVKGTIGIVGPKRMDYENVVDNLKNLKSQLDGIFDKEKGQS